MTRRPAILDTLTAAQRQRLAAAQTDPRVRAAVLDAAKPARVRSASAAPITTSVHVEPGGAVVVRVDGLRVTNPNNSRRHWCPVAREARETKATMLRALAAVRPPKGARWSVTMTREGRGVLDEDCGLNASLKHVRDAVGEWLGTGDAPSAPVAWRYAQTRTQSYAVVVRVEALT